MSIQQYWEPFGSAWLRDWFIPKHMNVSHYLFIHTIVIWACHSGSLESSRLFFLSWSVSLRSCSWNRLVRNISSAFSLLNEQHMPWSVGCMVKIAEQLSLCPFQMQSLIIPKVWIINSYQTCNLPTKFLTKVFICSGRHIEDVEAGQLGVPQQLKNVSEASFKIKILVGLPAKT